MMYRRKKGERGSVAVEFAMAFPVYIATLSLMYSLGLGLWARYQILNYATAAARTCAMVTPANTATMGGCAQTYLATAWQTQAAPCEGFGVETDATLQVPNNAGMRLLQVRVNCVVDWSRVFGPLNVLGVQMGPDTTQMPITAMATMPYLIPQF